MNSVAQQAVGAQVKNGDAGRERIIGRMMVVYGQLRAADHTMEALCPEWVEDPARSGREPWTRAALAVEKAADLVFELAGNLAVGAATVEAPTPEPEADRDDGGGRVLAVVGLRKLVGDAWDRAEALIPTSAGQGKGGDIGHAWSDLTGGLNKAFDDVNALLTLLTAG